MNYNETLDFIHSIPKFSKALGNTALEKLLSLLGNPHDKLKFVHIAGTNGKGSVAAMTASILQNAGYKTGLFTSPFIEYFNERIRINFNPIENTSLAEIATLVRKTEEENNVFVSEFAFICVVAFIYFARENCDIVILETGMGGRLDATNIIKSPIASVITSISLDHTMYLGDTIEKIAEEKLGIVKENTPLVLYPVQQESVFALTKNVCKEKNSPLCIPSVPEKDNGGFLYKNKHYPLSLKGSYQIYNAATVLAIIPHLLNNGFEISEENIKYGLANTAWAARFEFITPDFIIDGSHNIEGIEALCSDLKALNKKITLVVAMMSDKDFSHCVKALSEITDDVFVTELDLPRCCSAEALVEEFKKSGVTPKIIKKTTDAALAALNCGNTVCICGSLYLAGEIRRNISSLNIL